MHIILVSNRLATAKSISLGARHLVLGVALLATTVVVLSSSMFCVVFRHAAEINAMAVRLGQMQAQLMRLDALGERLSALAGIKPQEFRMSEPPGRGGALSTTIPVQDLSMHDFTWQLDALSKNMENRYDYMGILENRLFDAKVKKKLMPTVKPVDVDWNASSFGWRIDPITGQNAMHEGVDFLVDTGTPVHAAAAGLVVVAEFHPQYGYVVDIDHGNDFTTRTLPNCWSRPATWCSAAA